ncbi:methyltransferase domain-containing protein [Pedobacter sp. HMF7647]|uniref:Methyltransferase domain-containing protein n=1 Tax=Hufsiella arboris TaxID=2695275 RepID=A0A7K1YFQ4_9SPHI|nr:class I SAM-dependent methyltransferase [Hufsiella arboris]MXV52809.1 methyltransferase domain-containing protein [Hufsiella arboris]
MKQLFIDRSLGKIRSLLHRLVLGKMGFGNRVSRSIWEKQFAGTAWDYLNDPEEARHYLQIVEFYRKYGDSGNVLDIGCGKGVLYNYLEKDLLAEKYIGIDISQNAVSAAQKQYPGVFFRQADFEHQRLNETADVIIFNETLYYFNRPLAKLKECEASNLNANGVFIISMCDFSNHSIIWEQLEKSYTLLDEKEIINSNGQKWYVKVLKPQPPDTNY